MSLHARTLDNILSTTPPPAHPPHLECLLFKMSTATMALDQLQQVRKIRDVLGPGPILQLPAELLWKIFEILPQEDKGNLRRTNKLLCAVVKLPFARTLPSTWRFEMTEKSLNGLVNLTADKDLVTQCQYISFSTSRLKVLSDALTPRELAHNDRTNEHSSFLHGEYHTEAIVKALDNLRSNGRMDVTLGVYDEPGPRIGLGKAFATDEFSKFAGSEDKLRHSDVGNTVSALGTGAKCSGFLIQRLRIELYDLATLSSKDMFWTQLGTAIDLHFVCVNRHDLSVSSNQIRFESRNICIDFSSGPYSAHYGIAYTNLYHYLKARQHQEICFKGVFLEWRNLIRFVSKNTLVRLELNDIALRPGTTRTGLLKVYKWLKSLPSLEGLVVKQVRGGYRDWLPSEMCWQSREEIQTGLDKLISEIEA
ncbi:hypothetical protein KCU95_g4250, partial [Aureobasidium melanogenum]